jgi:hypothetical protein
VGRSLRHSQSVPTDLDAALAVLSAEALREVIHQLLLELDDVPHARGVASLIARAARSGSGWAPAPVTEEQLAEVLAFSRAAERIGHAPPSGVDEYLRRGSAAFVRKDYAAAYRIFGALLPPIHRGNIDLGQDELVDEVLGADVAECAAQYVVSAYMLTCADERAGAVRAAIDEVRDFGQFSEPLREMERVTVEPLADLAAFLPQWRALIASTLTRKRKNDWDTTGGCARSYSDWKERKAWRESRARHDAPNRRRDRAEATQALRSRRRARGDLCSVRWIQRRSAMGSGAEGRVQALPGASQGTRASIEGGV